MLHIYIETLNRDTMHDFRSDLVIVKKKSHASIRYATG